MSEWEIDRDRKRSNEPASKWMCEWVSKQASEWVSEWVRAWVSERVFLIHSFCLPIRPFYFGMFKAYKCPKKICKKILITPILGWKKCLSKKITARKKLNKCVGQYFSQIAMVIAAREKIVWSYFEAFLWRCNFFGQGLFFSRTSISGRLKWGIWQYGLNDQLRKTFFAFPARPGLGQHNIMASYDDFDVYCPTLKKTSAMLGKVTK